MVININDAFRLRKREIVSISAAKNLKHINKKLSRQRHQIKVSMTVCIQIPRIKYVPMHHFWFSWNLTGTRKLGDNSILLWHGSDFKIELETLATW